MLDEQIAHLARFDRKVLLNFRTLARPERRIGKDHVVAVLFLNIHDVFVQRIGAPDIGGRDAVQDHVHDRDDIGEGFLFLPIESLGLQRVEIGRGNVRRQHVAIGLDQEPRRATGPVIDRLADLGVHHLKHGGINGRGV